MSPDDSFSEKFIYDLYVRLDDLSSSQKVLLRLVFHPIIGDCISEHLLLERVLGWCLLNHKEIEKIDHYPILKKWWNIPPRPSSIGTKDQPESCVGGVCMLNVEEE